MTTDNAGQDADQPTVAKRLRQAREVAGLSVAEVAAKQHLRPAIISAIEAGDYRSIDSELFLKGYVRAYATYVGIDPDSVVRQLDKELEPLREEQKARVEASPLVTIERRKIRKRRIARIVGVLIMLAALFYAGSLYLANQEAPLVPETQRSSTAADETDGNEDSVVDDASGDNADVVEQVAVPESPSGDRASEPASNDSLDGSITGVSEETPAAIGGASDEETLPPAEEATQLTGQSEEVVSEPDAQLEPSETAPATSGTVPGEGDGTAAPDDDQGRLVVEFADDCWIEVQDSTGRTLVAELRRAGETLDVTGDSPLRVVLGAASAVSAMSYSGKPVSISDRQTRNDRLVLSLSD